MLSEIVGLARDVVTIVREIAKISKSAVIRDRNERLKLLEKARWQTMRR